MKKILKLVIIGFVIGCLQGFSFNCYAGIGIDPIQVEIMVEKGSETTGIFKISNTGEKNSNISIRFEDWMRAGVKPDSWLKMMPQNFSVEPGKTADINYVINVPKEATGEIMAMVFFDSLDEGSTVGAGFGIPVYVAIKGTEVVDAEVTELKVEYDAETGISGFITIKNKGNAHLRPYTTIQILNSKGKASGYFSIQFGVPIQVNKERKYDFAQSDIKLKKGRYKVVAESNYGSLYKMEKKARGKSRLVVE